MPTDRDFKQLVRARMKKTGEAYTAARAVLVARSARARGAAAPQTAPVAPTASARSYAELAGMADATIEKKTGCDWERWVYALDRSGAADWPHRAIAEHVQQAYKVSDWWAQTVTVGYERIKGLRAIGQRRGGSFEASKSKTVTAPPAAVSKAFTDSRLRRRWLPNEAVKVRKATAGKSVRMTWTDETSVQVWLVAKPGGKTGVQLTHTKLADKAAVDARKRYWAERLGALKKLLEAG